MFYFGRYIAVVLAVYINAFPVYKKVIQQRLAFLLLCVPRVEEQTRETFILETANQLNWEKYFFFQ